MRPGLANRVTPSESLHPIRFIRVTPSESLGKAGEGVGAGEAVQGAGRVGGRIGGGEGLPEELGAAGGGRREERALPPHPSQRGHDGPGPGLRGGGGGGWQFKWRKRRRGYG
jgi:hypothetical protein